ncbi:MAG: SDR family oxidoreductase [Acidimicrobiia bacterium]
MRIEAHPGRAEIAMFSVAWPSTPTAMKAFEFQKLGIRINAILPGPPTRRRLLAGDRARLRRRLLDAGDRGPRPDQQAGLPAFLCSEAAEYVNGEVMIVDAAGPSRAAPTSTTARPWA